MTDSADERAKVDRTKDPEDPNKDVREEYTAYREREPDQPRHDNEAAREADLQPGGPGSEAEPGEGERGEERGQGDEPRSPTAPGHGSRRSSS